MASRREFFKRVGDAFLAGYLGAGLVMDAPNIWKNIKEHVSVTPKSPYVKKV